MTEATVQIIPPGVKRWNGKTVLRFRDCVLLERFTGRSYSYWVVNTRTGASAHICHKKTPIPEAEREAIIERFLAPVAESAEMSGSVYCTDTMRDYKLERLPETLAHIFETLLPQHGYTLRPEQMELAKDIFEALRGRKVSLAEAGVGIGKTHAYLIAAALIKRGRVNDFWTKIQYPGIACVAEMPVVVATSGIALQKAIIKDYIPEISKILVEHGVITTPLTGVIRKGKEHYVCERRLRLLWKQTHRAGIKPLLEPIINGLGGIDLDELDNLDAYTKRRINVAGSCKSCPLCGTCRYKTFLADAQSDKYDFQICNHNYLLADTLHRSKGIKPLIPHYQAVIIDEAHKFPSAARSMYSMELSSLTMPRIAESVRGIIFGQGQSTAALWKDADKLESLSKQLFRVLDRNIPDASGDDDAERLKTVIDGTAAGCLRSISETLACLTEKLAKRQAIGKYRGLYAHTLRELGNIQKKVAAFEKHSDLIYWLEKPEGNPSFGGGNETILRSIPKRLGETLHADLWSKGIPIVLTSGTLSAAGDFTHIKQSCGLDKLSPGKVIESRRPSPFDYENNALIYISESVPFPDARNARYITAVADETERLIRAAHGHTAVMFTSYRVMDLVFEKLKKRGLPFPLFLMGRGNINAIEQFKQSGNGVLFAAGSIWEGIDLPGDILSMLIIVKLPFPVPDPISEYEKTLYGSMADYKKAVIVPQMLLRLLQGFGRLIRSMTDTGVVAILDSRVRAGGAYRGIVLRALPRCWVTSIIADIGKSLLEWKPHSYFLETK